MGIIQGKGAARGLRGTERHGTRTSAWSPRLRVKRIEQPAQGSPKPILTPDIDLAHSLASKGMVLLGDTVEYYLSTCYTT
jgi:hypothetical protein